MDIAEYSKERQFDQLNAHFGYMNSRLDGLQIELTNFSATHPIVTKTVAPVGAPQTNPPSPPLPEPAVFPGTRGELFALTGAQMSTYSRATTASSCFTMRVLQESELCRPTIWAYQFVYKFCHTLILSPFSSP